MITFTLLGIIYLVILGWGLAIPSTGVAIIALFGLLLSFVGHRFSSTL
jgi:hypothetical protein